MSKLRNQVTREIKKAKISHNTNKVRKLQKLDPGRWHKEVRNLCNMRKAGTTIHVADFHHSNHKQCDLKWDSQVDNILKKANQNFLLRKLKAAGLNSQELQGVY